MNLILSHESDIDGLGSIILGKLAFEQFDYELFPNPEALEIAFSKYLEQGVINKYDKIFITDLALYDPALTKVANSEFYQKVLIFDHHKKAIDEKLDRYVFSKIVESDEKGKKCGTLLFYEYLLQNNLIIPNKGLAEFVELVRLEDTWEWKKAKDKGNKAHDLAILFNSLGVEDFIDHITLKLLNTNSSFEFNDEEKNFIKNKKEEYEKNLEYLMSKAEYFIDEYENKFGIVFADYEYRNELAEYVKRINNPYNIEYLIIVAMNKGKFGQKSYRSINTKFDVNKIASFHGGGGHPNAASVNITEEQKSIALVLIKKEGLKYLANCSYKD